MMRSLILWTLLILTTWSCISAKYIKIEKRQICSNSGCGTCDGKSCNVCSNTDTCCSSVSCNKCATQCSNECSTVACKNNCVSGCSNSCQTNSCEVQSCSQCVNKCSNQCSTEQCVNRCSNQCNNCKEREEPIIIQPPEPSNVIVNNTNNNVINLTTHINIDNVVNNYNNISVPIFINTTNINNIDISMNRTEGGVVVASNGSSGGGYIPYPIPFPLPRPQNDNCCYVMHPRRCYTDDYGSPRCYIRRHRECSNQCTSPVVTIQEDEQQTNSQCHYTQNYPYVYCGNYVRRDCGQCYNCEGNYNPGECFQRSECSDACRRSVPNCVPSQSGLQCY